MSMKILFVGAVNRSSPPENGEEYKNQMILGFLDHHFHIRVIDTKNWSREPGTLLKLVFHMLILKYDRIILSASSASVFRLLDTFRFFKSRLKKTIYFVIGGYFPKALADGKYKVRAYQSLMSILVEGETMKSQLLSIGIKSQVHVIPNFKTVVKCHGQPDRFEEDVIRFIFVSRIAEAKGVDTIFKSLSDERLQRHQDNFSVDFFGPLEKEYEERFKYHLSRFSNCQYRGYLDFSNHPEASYETMSTYHAMLFPTYWMGEGFPGAIIDAFICGTPVIASDWNMNREVIENGKTGKLIPVRDADALACAMLDVIENRPAWKEMSRQCHLRAFEFDTKKVLNEHLNHII